MSADPSPPNGNSSPGRHLNKWLEFKRVVRRIADRHNADHVFHLSASLAYLSLLALVPISAISISLLASFVKDEQEQIFDMVVNYVFPFDENLLVTPKGLRAGLLSAATETAPVEVGGVTIESSLEGLDNLKVLSASPEIAAKVKIADAAAKMAAVKKNFTDTIERFVDQARSLGPIGLVLLIVTGFWLFDSVEDAFNKIWKSEERRPFIRRFTIFWLVLTLAPLLMVGPVIANQFMARRDFPHIVEVLWGITPFFLTWLAIWLFYMLIPTGNVQRKPAAISAFMVAIVWELAKRGFAEYVVRSWTYTNIYGNLSLIFFVLGWIYLTWLLILEGLEVTAYLQFPDRGRLVPPHGMAPEIRLLYSWGGLYYAGKNFIQGKGGTDTDSISQALGIDQRQTLKILTDLEEANILVRDRSGAWFPAVPLERITWIDVATRLNYDIDAGSISLSEWLESALRARGVVEYRQETETLPTLDALLRQKLSSAVLTETNGGNSVKRVTADPVLLSEKPDSEAAAPSQ